jgi:glycosyltransferase involved in cell wall biosynthesis
MVKTIIITGSYPPEICGVGDYVYNLINSKKAKEWELFYKCDWHFSKIISYIKELFSLKPGKIFLQYPTQGYKWSLVPHFICLYFSFFTKIKFVVVLHEYSQLTFKARFTLNLILFSANKIIVTNEIEKKCIIKINKSLKDKINIIKIFSNFTKSSLSKDYFSREYDIIYFGQLRPNKGIEFFISEISSYNIKKDKKIAIIGGSIDRFKSYGNSIITIAKENGIECIISRPTEEVSNLLNNSKIMFLPFPGGCSERNGTYLAGLINGCVVVTLNGKYVTASMLKTAFFLTSENTVGNIFNEILFYMTKEKYNKLQENINFFLKTEIPHSWDDIVDKYNEV